MTAFPQLGTGFKSNTSHLVKEIEPSQYAIDWWRNDLTNDEKLQILLKEHEGWCDLSNITKSVILMSYHSNPQHLYEKYQ